MKDLFLNYTQLLDINRKLSDCLQHNPYGSISGTVVGTISGVYLGYIMLPKALMISGAFAVYGVGKTAFDHLQQTQNLDIDWTTYVKNALDYGFKPLIALGIAAVVGGAHAGSYITNSYNETGSDLAKEYAENLVQQAESMFDHNHTYIDL